MQPIDPATCHPVRKASHRIPGNPSIPTVFRWVLKGIKNKDGKLVVLESFKVGRNRFVSDDGIAKFIRELNEPTVTESPAVTDQRARDAGDALEKMGM